MPLLSGKSKEQLEVERFLVLLERRIQELSETAEKAGTGLAAAPHIRTRFADYLHVRDLSSECWAFSIVIERRIADLVSDDSETLRTRFEQLTVTVWSTLLDCSLRFLDALSREEELPLGSREVFVREIKTLYDAHRLLSDDRYAAHVDDSIMQKHRRADRILSEIIDRAPTLLDFGA